MGDILFTVHPPAQKNHTLCSPGPHGPSWPCPHGMWVIAKRLGCLRWLAHAAGHGHFLGASTTWRTASSFFTTTHNTKLSSKNGDSLHLDMTVLGT